MANKKRDINGYRKRLGRYRLNRADILAIEKILWVYADAREMRLAEVETIPEGRKHMPRRAVDRHVQIGRYRPFYITAGWGECAINYPGVDYVHDADSVKFLSKSIKKTRYIEVACKPGITVTFAPLSTKIYAQTQYATGNELRIMRDTVSKIEDYLQTRKRAYLNHISIR